MRADRLGDEGKKEKKNRAIQQRREENWWLVGGGQDTWGCVSQLREGFANNLLKVGRVEGAFAILSTLFVLYLNGPRRKPRAFDCCCAEWSGGTTNGGGAGEQSGNPSTMSELAFSCVCKLTLSLSLKRSTVVY